MLLVILGAGASFDSVNVRTAYASVGLALPPEYQWQPPLAQKIFEGRDTFRPILQSYSPALPLAIELRQRLDTDQGLLLERELDKVQQRALHDPKASQQLMAVRFYLRAVLEQCGIHWARGAYGATNYRWLVEKLDRWARDNGESITYVTFNYDLMLEDAVALELGHRFEHLGSYIDHDRFKLIKVHGSVDWGYRITKPGGQDEASWVIEHAHELDLSATRGIELRMDWRTGVNNEAWVPALAVPLENKDDFVCPPEHVQVLSEALPHVDRLLVIGWRATERRFLELARDQLRRTLSACLVACADQNASRSTWDNISRAVGGFRIESEFMNDSHLGFSNLVGSEAIDRLLP